MLLFKQEFFDAVPHLTDDVILPKDTAFDSPADHDAVKSFCALLREQGQLDPILCDEEGYILDGYLRFFCLQEMGVKSRYQMIGGLQSDAEKITFIRSRKLARHHLTTGEKIIIVQAELRAHPRRSNAWHARLLGVSDCTIAKYRRELVQANLIPAVTHVERMNGGMHIATPKFERLELPQIHPTVDVLEGALIRLEGLDLTNLKAKERKDAIRLLEQLFSLLDGYKRSLATRREVSCA